MVTVIFLGCDLSLQDPDSLPLKPWIRPLEGSPAFDQVKIKDVEEAILTPMEFHFREIETIANNMTPPTFLNTIFAMERNEAELERAYPYDVKIWADVLTANATEAFRKALGGFYDEQLANRWVEYLFATRNSIDPVVASRMFRGHDPQIDASIWIRDFVEPKK